MLDLAPATRTLTDLVQGVRPDQLTSPTPCEDMSVAQLLHHIDGFSLVFAAAARKAPLPGAAPATSGAGELGPGWRDRIPERLAELAHAWADERAWGGTTCAAGVDLTGDVAGLFAGDEVIVHSWDLAVATGQSYDCAAELLEPLRTFLATTVSENPNGSPGLFGPPVAVATDASLLNCVLGLTGRNPDWRPIKAGVAG